MVRKVTQPHPTQVVRKVTQPHPSPHHLTSDYLPDPEVWPDQQKHVPTFAPPEELNWATNASAVLAAMMMLSIQMFHS